MPEVKINQQYHCNSRQIGNVDVVYSGELLNIDAIVESLESHQGLSEGLYALILANKKNYSLIVRSDKYVFAMVDRIKSHPLFYTKSPDAKIVSNCATCLHKRLPKTNLSSQSLLEFIMAGYVVGRDTLYDEIKQLQAGELLFWKNDDAKPIRHRYYRYLPAASEQVDSDKLLHQLGDKLDSIMDDLILQADGRPIFVPLSGGLDSRFILSKLVEKQYDNVMAFTYGINGNHEMRHAAKVAKVLGVPWIKLPSNTKRAASLFDSDRRREYEQYSHSFSSIPYYGEFEALSDLVDRNLISENAMIVNGQSGDFITGGHVRTPILDRDSAHDDIFDYIVHKHFSLWLPEKTPENIDRIKTHLQIQFDELTPAPRFPNFYEYWEWQERQCKNVIRGQRLYEFFGFSWALPFWHADLMDFYKKVPYSLKYKQYLYIEYLRQYNYKGLFNLLRRKVQPWVLRYRWIPLAAKFLKIARGDEAKQDYYRRKDFYSTYHHQYAMYGKDCFLTHYKDLRNPESLILRDLVDRLYL